MSRVFELIKKAAVVLFFIVLLTYALIEAKTLLYPIVLAMLFAFLLLPMANYLERKGFTRILTNFIVIFAAAAVISAIMYLLYSRIGNLVSELPSLKEHASANVENMTRAISDRLGVST